MFSDYTMEPKKGPYPLLSQRITGIWLNRRDYITAELQTNRDRPAVGNSVFIYARWPSRFVVQRPP